MQDPGYKIQGLRHSEFWSDGVVDTDARCRMQDARNRHPDVYFFSLNPESWILYLGPTGKPGPRANGPTGKRVHGQTG